MAKAGSSGGGGIDDVEFLRPSLLLLWFFEGEGLTAVEATERLLLFVLVFPARS